MSSLLFLLVCVCALPLSVQAEPAANARLVSFRSESFPRLDAFLRVQNEQGRFLHDVQPEQIHILENDEVLQPDRVEEVRPGAQVVIAIDPGHAFGVRNSKGLSRYDLLRENLIAWGKSRRGSNLDDWSLLITNGPEITHTSDPASWVTALEAAEIETRDAEPSFDTLVQALDLASDPTPRPGMGRVVLFITPLLENNVELPFQNLVGLAREQNILIFVWMVAPASVGELPGAQALHDFAVQAGGQFFSFSNEEALPDPETYVEPQRNVYYLAYKSGIKNSGEHQVIFQIDSASGKLATEPYNFNLEIAPPNPAFIAPELEIIRQPVERPSIVEIAGNSRDSSAEYTPDAESIQVIIDFPDGRRRALERTTLYVDGEVADENQGPPFDIFTWDLKSYQKSGEHLLRVEAEDILGLSGSSIEVMVQVTVKEAASSPWAQLSPQLPLIAGLAALTAAAIFLLVMILTGRIQPRSFAPRSPRKQESVKETTAPEAAGDGAARLPGWINRFHWPQRRVSPQAYAFLTPLDSGPEGTETPPPAVLDSDEITLGADPNQATLVLSDSSIASLHARLVRDRDGSTRLIDEGSVAGTWINYTPVGQTGSPLRHGDVFHLGRVGFRFTLRQPGTARKVVVRNISSTYIPRENNQK